MEQNALNAEDSIESIPGPAYEQIVGSTSIGAGGQVTGIKNVSSNASVDVKMGEIAEMEEEECSDFEDEDLDAEDEQEEVENDQTQAEGENESLLEVDYTERDDFKENESQVEQKSLSAFKDGSEIVTPTTVPAEQVNDVDTSTTITSTKSALEIRDDCKTTFLNEERSSEVNVSGGVCPVPVQIVSAVSVKPKMVPIKSKNNKLVMVQLINEKQLADNNEPSGISSSGDQIANDTSNTANETADTVTKDMVKSNTLNEDKSPSSSQQQQQHFLLLARSSTPLSREFLALQRSVNESKVLSEFVTDAVRKRQKGTPKDANDNSPLHHQQHHYHHHNTYAERHRKSSKFAPLKEDGNSSTSSTLARRSRSKSVNRKSFDIMDVTTSGGKLKRWPSDEKMLKRTNMRSQNSEFVQKQIEFLNRVKHDEGEVSSEADDGERSYVNGGDYDELNMGIEHNFLNDSNASTAGIVVGSASSLLDATLEREGGGASNGALPVNMDSVEARLMAYWAPPPKRGWDSFCWKCRECIDLFPCSKCVRCFHCTCIKVTAATKLDDSWICPECMNVENVLNGPKRSSRRSEMSLDLLSQLLSFALKRMKMVKGCAKFLYTKEDLLHYSKYIINPVTFATLQEKIEKRAFRCSEEFLNETKWILHNALILNSSSSSKEVFTAKAILKVCRQEANEIDTCGECYLNANTRTDWFVDVCAQPHLLLWAKLKGFPYWPAKAMGPGQGLSHVNVRFFGEHDRAFVPVKDCFLYSEQDPNTQTGKRSARELADCIKEVEIHIEKIKAKVGAFRYAKFKIPYEPSEELQQLEMMMPGVTEYMKRQQVFIPKPPLQYKIVKTADNHLSIIKKACTTESGNDSDNSNSPSKKNCVSSSACSSSGCGIGGSGVNDIKTSLIATKYEVVSKASPDDNNSSKVTAVILKRKSENHKKETGVGEDLELPMPKMIKFDEEENERKRRMDVNTTHVDKNNVTGKRKHAADTSGTSPNTSASSSNSATKETEPERHRTKHAKHEPQRIPLLTIKTNTKELSIGNEVKAITSTPTTLDSNKIITTTTSANLNTTTEEKTTTLVKEEFVTTTGPSVSAVQTNNVAQMMMENLVKNKHGVTIKKISKDVSKKLSNDESSKAPMATNKPQSESTANTSSEPGDKTVLAPIDGTNSTQENNASNNNSASENSSINKNTNSSNSSGVTKIEEDVKKTNKSTPTTHILKDLVPFVEIKKEITSDDETENETSAKKDVQCNSKKNNMNLSASEKVNVTAAAAIAMPAPKLNCNASMPAPLLLPPITGGIQPNLLLVKREVTSDEEEPANATSATPNLQPSLNNLSVSGEDNLISDSEPYGSLVQTTLPDAVRVGDTMIQRVNVKNIRNMQPSLVSLKSPAQAAQEAAAAMDAATVMAAAMHTSPPSTNRRHNTRGIPYGPLPASAVLPMQSQAQLAKSTVTANNTTRTVLPQLPQQPISQMPSQSLTQVSQLPLQPAQQRARKSFPNRSTPDISPARNNYSAVTQASPSLPPASTSPLTTNNDLKRSTLLKNSMVSIPRQAWSPHESQRNANISNNNTGISSNSTHSIPVPPLTAVSKTPAVLTSLSGDENSVANTNLSNNNMLSSNCNSNVNPTINSTPIATPFVTCNGGVGTNGSALLAPLTMSAPPPLAGLSQPSINILAPTAVVSIAASLPFLGGNNNNNSSSVNSSSSSISISSVIESPVQAVGSATTSTLNNLVATSTSDVVTPSLTSIVTDAICRGPPKMIQRPNGPLQSDSTAMFPSQAGPVCQTLVENAHKLTDFFISVMEDTMVEMSVGEEPLLQAKITLLKIELERTKQAYEQEISQLKRTSDLMLCEMRKSMENEKTRIANEIRKQCEQERLRSIEETKKKQWCSNCAREAQFYCCWNTSYCDYPCQQMHWSRHSATCAQTRPTNVSANDSLAKSPTSITTTVSSLGIQHQQHQHSVGVTKVSTSNIMAVTPTTTTITATHYNKNTMNNKKHGTSKAVHQMSVSNSVNVGGTNVCSSSMAAIAAGNVAGVSVSAGTTTELLKLPTNTYLRTVPQCGNAGGNNNSGGGGNMRGSSYSVQRVNIPLPITALVQRGNSWELTSAAPNNNTGTANMATLSAPGSNAAAPTLSQLTPQQQQQQQQQQHQRMLNSSGAGQGNMSLSRGSSRNRAAAAQAMQQQTMSTLHSTSTSGTSATTLPCGVMRPTQM